MTASFDKTSRWALLAWHGVHTCTACTAPLQAQVLDQDGVGQLVHFAVERGRASRPGLKIGICGEQVSGGSRFCGLAPMVPSCPQLLL